MDPKKQLTNLDPKLKETYDRVMGMNLPDTPQPPQQPVQQPVEMPPPPEMPKPAPDAVGVVTTIHAEEVKQMAHPPASTLLKKDSSPITYLAIAVGLFVFFIIYTIIWFKYFNVPIPFLGSFF